MNTALLFKLSKNNHYIENKNVSKMLKVRATKKEILLAEKNAIIAVT